MTCPITCFQEEFLLRSYTISKSPVGQPNRRGPRLIMQAGNTVLLRPLSSPHVCYLFELTHPLEEMGGGGGGRIHVCPRTPAACNACLFFFFDNTIRRSHPSWSIISLHLGRSQIFKNKRNLDHEASSQLKRRNSCIKGGYQLFFLPRHHCAAEKVSPKDSIFQPSFFPFFCLCLSLTNFQDDPSCDQKSKGGSFRLITPAARKQESLDPKK